MIRVHIHFHFDPVQPILFPRTLHRTAGPSNETICYFK